MTAAQPALDGMPVPPVQKSECDWVLRKACGCPIGVATGRHHRTEDDAWRGFCDTWKGIAEALRRGERIELMPHARYSAEVLPQMLAGYTCPHYGAS